MATSSIPGLSNIMDLFRSAPQSAPANPNPPNPNAPTGAANPGAPLPGTQQTGKTDNNGVVPNQDPNANPGEPGDPRVSALDKHKDIWQTVVDPNAKPDDGSLFGNLDAAKVMESARKVDFAKIVTPEDLKKIAAGGEDAAAVFLKALNGVAQTVYANSAIATTKIVEQAVATERQRAEARMPGMVRKLTASENLREDNPIFSNPAVAPMVEAMTQQFQNKNPNASSAEIRTQVADYFDSIGVAFAPKQKESENSGKTGRAPKSEDWSKFLE